jgi:hypothetical protein
MARTFMQHFQNGGAYFSGGDQRQHAGRVRAVYYDAALSDVRNVVR